MATLIIQPDSFSPIYQGDTLYPLSMQFWTYQLVNGVQTPVAINLSGLTIGIKFQNEAGTVKVGANAWVTDDATNGLAHYPYNAVDVNIAGTWTLYITLTNGSGQVAHTFTKTLTILSAP